MKDHSTKRALAVLCLFIIMFMPSCPACAVESSDENTSSQNYDLEVKEIDPDARETMNQDLSQVNVMYLAKVLAAWGDPFYLTPTRIGLMFLPLPFALYFFFLRRKYRMGEMVIESVQFYPPDDLDPQQMAFIYKGLTSHKGIASMAVYFAEKEYLAIDYTDGTYTLRKLKEYDGQSVREREFLEKLFSKSDQISEEEFYRMFSGLRELLWEQTNPYTIFTPLTGMRRMLLACLGFSFIVPPFIYLMVSANFWGRGQIADSIFNIAITGAMSAVVGMIVFSTWRQMRYKKYQVHREGQWEIRDYIQFTLLFSGGFIVTNLLFMYELYPWRFMLFNVVYWVCCVLMVVALLSIRKRTEYGTQLLGKILGFKRFLELAEKDRLESLFAENPQYYYDILPYTYALGVSDTWIKKHAQIITS